MLSRREGFCLVYLLLSSGYQRGSWYTQQIYQNISPAYRIFFQRNFEQTDREDVHLFDLLNWSKVKDNVADAFFFLADRVNSKTLKLDGSSLQSEETTPSRGISVTRLTFSQPYFRKFFCGLRENLFSVILQKVAAKQIKSIIKNIQTVRQTAVIEHLGTKGRKNFSERLREE